MVAIVPLLPSLAEFPEEKEVKELNLKQEKKQVSEKQFFLVQDVLSKKMVKSYFKTLLGRRGKWEMSCFLSETTGNLLSSG